MIIRIQTKNGIGDVEIYDFLKNPTLERLKDFITLRKLLEERRDKQ